MFPRRGSRIGKTVRTVRSDGIGELEGLEMKHRIVHALQKYVLNPPIKLALVVRLHLPGYAFTVRIDLDN